MRLALFFALVALPLAGLGACRTTAPVDEAPPARFASMDDYQTRRGQAAARLTAAIGEARADAASACRTVAVGAKACGGPTEYRVYSSTASDAAEVERLAGAVTALDQTANRQFSLASTCEMLLEPTPALVGGRCVARP